MARARKSTKSGSAKSARPAAKRTAAKGGAAKRTTAKRTAAKGSAAKRPAAKRTAAKSSAAKRTAKRGRVSAKREARPSGKTARRAVGSAKITTDHDEIRRWVERNGGCPATVKASERRGEPGILRIDYTGFSGRESLEKIPWREFFKKFDESRLAFLYQDKTKAGRPSRFSKLVRREG